MQRLATLVLDVALVQPFKRRRWRHLAARHRDLFHRAVAALGPEFFDGVLLDYGDTGGPLWDALEEFQPAPPWTARPCACGSGLPFHDCCMEREDTWADEAASAAD
ncbi:MAG: SEC-C domain-containing protein [Verrucomicrobia bacterium]|nr:SEC-C domain-containing protein [Verrucomicrobiota bacterium]